MSANPFYSTVSEFYPATDADETDPDDMPEHNVY